MGMSSEISGVALKYVARKVIGDVKTVKTVFNEELQENEQEEKLVKDPVIVFFPNKTSQVMSLQNAESKGFLERPEILNFAQVNDQTTSAGRFKNALHDRERKIAWLELEQAIITGCCQKSGHPVDPDCRVSEESMYYLSEPMENNDGFAQI